MIDEEEDYQELLPRVVDFVNLAAAVAIVLFRRRRGFWLNFFPRGFEGFWRRRGSRVYRGDLVSRVTEKRREARRCVPRKGV